MTFPRRALQPMALVVMMVAMLLALTAGSASAQVPIPTEVPTEIPTGSPSPTPSPTPTETPTEDPCATPSPTESPTASESPTPTESPSSTTSPCPTESPSETASPTPTPTQSSAEPTFSPAPAPTGDPFVSPTTGTAVPPATNDGGSQPVVAEPTVAEPDAPPPAPTEQATSGPVTDAVVFVAAHFFEDSLPGFFIFGLLTALLGVATGATTLTLTRRGLLTRRSSDGEIDMDMTRRWRMSAGAGLLGVAAVIGIIGYQKISLETLVPAQIVYLASAGFAMVLFAVAGGALIISEQLRADERRVQELEKAVVSLAGHLSASVQDAPRLLMRDEHGRAVDTPLPGAASGQSADEAMIAATVEATLAAVGMAPRRTLAKSKGAAPVVTTPVAEPTVTPKTRAVAKAPAKRAAAKKAPAKKAAAKKAPAKKAAAKKATAKRVVKKAPAKKTAKKTAKKR